MNVTTISTGNHATQAAVESITNVKHQQQTYKIEMLEDSMASDDDDDDLISSDGSMFDESESTQIAVQDDLANQLAAAGPVGVAAAAAIASSKKRKRQHSFETNPSVRKRQQNRLLRKLRGIIYEFTGRVGKQAVVLVATPGKPNTSYKVFGAKPLEDVVRNLKNIVMDELENALAQQAPPPPQEDPSLFELPPLIIDGIPTPVEKMTQAQLRAFIPLMLKYSTGRGKPGWGREATRPPWWPKELPWANVRMDARSEDDKQKISWTHALRKIVINCYKYHGREDLLPTFADEEEKVTQMISHEEEEEEEEVIVQPVSNQATTIQTIHTTTNAPTNTTTNVRQQVNVVKINSSGTVITTTNPHNPNNPGPTIIQSTNDQHITTTARLPASTKIELCPAPIQVQVTQQQHQQQVQQQQQQQQQQQHHQQQQQQQQVQQQVQQQQHHQHQVQQQQHVQQHQQQQQVQQQHVQQQQQQQQVQQQQQQQQQHHQIQTTNVTSQQLANAQVCIEPMTLGDVDYTQTVLSTIQNADGTVSLIQVDPNNPIITLPDGTTAQVQGVATLHQGEGGATIQTVQSLGDVNGHENMTVDLTEATVAQDGQIYITAEDGQGYPVSVSNMITLPVSASMYQSMMANIQQIHTNSDGTVCITPMQVDANNTNNNTNSNANTTNTNNNNSNTSSNSNSSNSNNNNDNDGNSNGTTNTTQVPQFQCYSIMTATPIAAATAHHHHNRLLTNTALNQTQNLVNNLNINNSNSNNNTNSNSSSSNISNIRCQIINASSLQQNSSQLNCQQQQNYLANVLQNATTKVFIASPTHLNLTSAANILNNNNNDATANNNNHNNNNQNGHIKLATAMPLPIVVATTAQHPQTMTVAAAASAAASNAETNNGRSTISSNTTNSVSRKSGHKRRKQTFAKVLPIKVEEQISTDANNTNTMQNSNGNAAENLLNIQIVNTSDNSVVVAGGSAGGGGGGGNNASASTALNVGGVVGSLGNLRVGHRLVSVDITNAGSQLPTKTIKLETVEN